MFCDSVSRRIWDSQVMTHNFVTKLVCFFFERAMQLIQVSNTVNFFDKRHSFLWNTWPILHRVNFKASDLRDLNYALFRLWWQAFISYISFCFAYLHVMEFHISMCIACSTFFVCLKSKNKASLIILIAFIKRSI